MKVKIASVILSTLAGQAVVAETMSSTENVAPIHKILPDAYSTVEMRHKLKEKDSREVGADIRALLGSKFYDGNLSVELSAGVKHSADTSTIEQKSTDLESVVGIIGNSDVALCGYMKNEFLNAKTRNADVKNKVGFVIPMKYLASTEIGAFTIGSQYRLTGIVYDKEQTVEINTKDGSTIDSRAKDAFSLTSDGKYKTTARGVPFEQYAFLEVKYSPNYVSGMSLEYRVSHKNISTPRHVISGDRVVVKNGKVLGTPVFDNQGITVGRLRAKYDISKTIFVQNDLAVASSRTSEKGIRPITNVFSLGANLF